MTGDDRREFLRRALAALAMTSVPSSVRAAISSKGDEGGPTTEDVARLTGWVGTLRDEGLCRRDVPLGRAAVRAGELARGTPYVPGTLETYLTSGSEGARRAATSREPLTVSLERFDCVTLVESCLAVARVARAKGAPSWDRFAREIERMRYRGGKRLGYASRLHYFSEWIHDGEQRGLVHDLSASLGGSEDARPLRFMTEHRGSYPALADDTIYRETERIERGLDGHSRRVVPTERIASVTERIETGDILAFATSIPALDVTHSAMAYRDGDGVLRVLHAPLSGGVVEISRRTLPDYVANIRRATGILVARPI